MNDVVYGSKQFKKYRDLTKTSINNSKLYDCFMERFNELIKRVNFTFNFFDSLFLNYCLQSLKTSLVLPMFQPIYFFAADLQIQMKVSVEFVHVYMLKMLTILFP